jgi:hypothetical protein
MINITELKKRLLSEAEELSPKQKKIAGAAEPKDKITGADFAALRAKKGMKEDHEDHEVSMAQNSLKSIISSASQLMNLLGQDEKDIPAWIQDHITNAENYINQASKNYHEYSHGEEDIDELPNGTEEEPVDDMHNLSLAGLMEDMLGEDDDDDYGSYGDTEIADYDTEYDTGVDEAKKKPSAGLTKKQKSAISKKAKAGKDIGKKGKGFEKIAKAAAEKYGSKERGQKVAAAAMWKSAAKKAK